MQHFKIVPLASVIPLRHLVLRAGKPIETCYFDGDQDPKTWHAALFVDENAVAIGTFLQVSHPAFPQGVQLRGMAVHPDFASQGIGTAFMQHVLFELQSQGVTQLWCNARLTAESFYVKQGFTRVGAAFDVPGIGPHVVMGRFI
ncbi:MAG: GNAT family N-acetyltransferase [Flavobacterium sp. BFFFF2]|nr:MAG: GNAT family N-acetyltransferase [Flavobacterium sp. BFFFF2]